MPEVEILKKRYGVGGDATDRKNGGPERTTACETLLEMERIHCGPGETKQGAIMLVLDLVKAFAF